MAEPQDPTAIATYTAPDSGAKYASTDGKVWLTKGGKFYSADPTRLDDVYGQLGEGTRPATAQEVAGRLREKANDTVGGRVATVIENVTTGAVSAAALGGRSVALLAGDDELAKTFTGESVTRDMAGLRTLVGSGGDLNAVAKAENERMENLAARRRQFPTLSAVSQVVGEVALTAATGGLSAAPGLIAGRSLPSAALRVAGTAAAENALLSTGTEVGAAALENRDIDRERLAADGLSAAIFGAALGVGGVVAGRGAAALKNKFKGASVDGAGEAARAAELKSGSPATIEESLAAAKNDAARAVDEAGINPVARAEAAESHAGALAEKAAASDPTDWRKFTRESNAVEQYVHRDAVLDGATRDASDDLNKVLERQRPVYDEIDNLTAKREKVAEHIAADGVDETALLARAQEDTAGLRDRLEGLRAELDAQRAENINIPETAGKPKKTGAHAAIERADFIIRQAEKKLAKVDSAADGVVAVDSMRRELAKVWRQSRQSLQQTAGLEERMLLEPVQDFLKAEYQRAADSLMDASFVGKTQASAQSSVNRARVAAIDGEEFDLKGFVTRISKDGAEFGRVTHSANRDTLRSMLSEIQPGPAARLKTEQFERFLQSQQEVFEAIKGNYTLTPGNAKKLDELLESVNRMKGTLDSARDASGKVNQAKAIIDADNLGGGRVGQMVAGAAVGGVEGGLGGAVRGFARGALGGTEQVVALRQRMGALAESHDSKIASAMTGWIDKLIGGKKPAAGKGKRKFLSDETRAAFSRAIPEEKTLLGGALGMSPGLRRFMGASGETRSERREILQERRQQLAELITNPARVQQAAAAALGDSAQYMPGMAAQVVAETMERLTKLHDKLGGASKPSLLPAIKQPEMVSDQELHAQDALVQATLNPMSVFTDFAQGKVDPIKTAFVREMYPNIWAQAQAASIDALSRVDKMPSRQSLTQIDLFLDLKGSLEPSLRPDFLARQVERSKMAEAQDKPVAPSNRKAPDIASKFATTSQRLGTS